MTPRGRARTEPGSEAVRHAPPTALLVAGVIAVALNLRAPITSVPPLVQQIQDSLGLSAALAGALTTLPLICMGAFAPPAQRLAHRVGRERAISMALLCVLVGLLMRLGSAHVVLLYAGVVVAGAGIAVAGTVLPGIVKEFFPGRAGTMTGLYMAAMMTGATVSAALAVPLADRLGSWERSLASWSLLAIAGLAVWTPVRRRVPPHRPTGTPTRLPWGSGTAWIVTVYLSLNSIIFYSLLAWLAPMYEQRGETATRAGLMVATLNLAQLVAALLVPTLADRRPDRRPGFVIATGCTLAGLVWLLAAPTTTPYVLALVLGFGLGAGFTLGLVLLVDYAPDPTGSARLSALAFLVSYLIAATGPVLCGVLRDATGTFTATVVALTVLQVSQVLLVPALRPGRLVH